MRDEENFICVLWDAIVPHSHKKIITIIFSNQSATQQKGYKLGSFQLSMEN
jgi:hypothetical protein